jgi:hypothetical protein
VPASERAPPLSTLDLDLLRHGELTVEGRLVDASNATLYCTVSLDGVSAVCVHKPVRGERPLWDFPDGTLAGREVSTYLVSEALGWDLVPPTVLRDGPFGPGMCQLWIHGDETVDLRGLVMSTHQDLQRMVLLDAVVNNADRKGGHLIPTTEGRILGVDHGVCFSVDDKLRTVLWQWRGEPLADEAVDALHRLLEGLDAGLGQALAEQLTRREVVRTRLRISRMLEKGCYPSPSEDWPAIPWPPF